MPYLIAIIGVVIIAAGFTLLRPEPTTTTTEQSVPLSSETMDTEETTSADQATMEVATETTRPADTPTSPYADGSFTARTSYFTPRRVEHVMDITLTVENGIVVDASILWDGSVAPKTPSHAGFDTTYKAQVVGKSLDSIALSRVGGASLTSESFNVAVEDIKDQAAS